MMNILKQIQHDLADQKEYMRNLHVINRNINEKYNLMAGKMDQQQVIIQRLEQQVRKNNMILFGYDDKEVHFEDTQDKTTMYTQGLDNKEMKGHLVKESEKNEEKQLKIISEADYVEDTELNCKDDSRKNDGNQKICGRDQVEEVVINKFNETKELTPTTYIRAEQIKQLIDDLKQNTFMYQSQIKEIKELIRDLTATTEASIEDARTYASKQETASVSATNLMIDQISKLNGEFKNIVHAYQSDMKEIKEFIKGVAATDRVSTKDYEIGDRKQETVQISSNYLSTDQISKLNADLKQIAEKYQSSNIFPIIEIIPGPGVKHYVMDSLTRGVMYMQIGIKTQDLRIKLGMPGFERSKVQDLLTEYPQFSLYDVVKVGLMSMNEWSDMCDKYNWSNPINSGY